MSFRKWLKNFCENNRNSKINFRDHHRTTQSRTGLQRGLVPAKTSEVLIKELQSGCLEVKRVYSNKMIVFEGLNPEMESLTTLENF